MIATVKKLGFDELTVLENPTRIEMDHAMTDFGRAAAKTTKASFFYFSGHGVLHNKLNYLIPAKANTLLRALVAYRCCQAQTGYA